MDISLYEKRYIEAGLAQFKPYLLSEEILWNLGLARPEGMAPYPQLSLGNLLLAKKIFETQSHSDSEGTSILNQVDSYRSEWQSAWQAKAEKEFAYRQRQWYRFIDDFEKEPGRFQASLKNDVRTRAILEILKIQGDGKKVNDGMNILPADQIFRRSTKEGDFLWPLEIENGFDRQDYWFIYRKIK